MYIISGVGGQESKHQTRRGTHPAQQGLHCLEYPPDQDGSGGVEDAGSSSLGHRDTENRAMWFGEGLATVTSILFLHTTRPHRTAGRTHKRLDKHEPKSTSVPRSHMNTHPHPTLTLTHTHTVEQPPPHFVPDCTGHYQTGLSVRNFKTHFSKKKKKKIKKKSSLIILTQTLTMAEVYYAQIL